MPSLVGLSLESRVFHLAGGSRVVLPVPYFFFFLTFSLFIFWFLLMGKNLL